MSVSGSVARRYARALMEIGLETGKLKALQRDLKKVADTIEGSDELMDIFKSPAVQTSQRKQIFGDVLKRLSVTGHIRNTCMLLIDRGRASILPAIARELEVMVDDHEGIVRGEVISATPLSKTYLDRLNKALQTVTGKKIELSSHVDNELLGGVITRVGGVVYDGSLKARLSKVRELMLH